MQAMRWLDLFLSKEGNENDRDALSNRLDRFYALCGLPPLIVNEKDGSILVWIPPGEFEMGDGQSNDSPRHRVHLDGYYLAVHCITNQQYQYFVEATGHRPPDNNFWQKADKAEHPVVNVRWKDANAYCIWAGLALPTEAQWEQGARGLENLLYPWGNGWDVGKCRNFKNRGRNTTCPVWAYPQGISGFGTMNQSGNVWEWCQDWYSEDYYRNSSSRNPDGPNTGSNRVFRGGGWYNDYAEYFRASRRRDDPARRRGLRGFRPCLSASPRRER